MKIPAPTHLAALILKIEDGLPLTLMALLLRQQSPSLVPYHFPRPQLPYPVGVKHSIAFPSQGN